MNIVKKFAPLCVAAIASSFCVSTSANAGTYERPEFGVSPEQNFGLLLRAWSASPGQNFGFLPITGWGAKPEQNFGWMQPGWGVNRDQNFGQGFGWGANQEQNFGIPIFPWMGVNPQQNLGIPIFHPWMGVNPQQQAPAVNYAQPQYQPQYVQPQYVMPQYVLPQYVLPQYVLPQYQPAIVPQQGAAASGPVQCSINQVPALTKSVDDCERAGGEVPAAPKAPVKTATN